ncbi:hypothetical protein [Nesterenkonia sp. PF2B19]|uniref:hypothetical protein n=1 Tax=Nesterenkonia sp. PF2B19 TaxID=1881858 RepID=UPI00087217F4|nr:hypothetical protein [Nesterenkonia sp. PF2B19]OSM42518.1 hypothetical protein BCY76_013915 [Nesterenkonia sp. PF2B19]
MTLMFIIGTVVCAASTLICWVMTALRRHPADSSIISLAAVELFLVVYGIYAAVRQLGFDASIAGEAWEFWGYVFTALLLPVGVFVWAMIDKTRWSNLVMSFVGLVVFVMVYRMEVIWWGSATAPCAC